MPEVSIIIPAYNQDKFLGETIESILSQTYKDFECIIIDDGSTDKTKDIVRKYSDDDRIKYFYQDNIGLAGARNTGIKMAKGKYLHFLDSDDLVHKNFYKDMRSKLELEPGIDLLSCAWDLIDENGRVISSKIGPVKSDDHLKDLILQNIFPVHSIILKSKVLEGIGPFNEELSALEDWDLWLRAALRKYAFDTLDIIGVSYRRHKEGMTLDIKRMTENLNLFLDNFYRTNPRYQKYRPYTHLYQMLNIYLYAEESGDLKSQEETIEKINNLLGKTTYVHYYLEKIYEVIRNIRNKKVKLKLIRDIHDAAPSESKRFWRDKILKARLKNFFIR